MKNTPLKRIQERMDKTIETQLNAVGLQQFASKWKYTDGEIKSIFRALLSDHLFQTHYKLYDLKSQNSNSIDETQQEADFDLNNYINHKQYIASLYYFYGIKQVTIDNIEASGVIGYSKSNASKNILNRYREKLIVRAKFINKMLKTNSQLDEIDTYINKLWN